MRDAMHDLLKRVLAAHGGLDRWNNSHEVSATVVTGGEFWGTKGIPTDDIRRRARAGIHEEWATLAPFGNPDWHMTFAPTRVVIEASDKSIVAERDDPKSAFAGHGLETPWDPLHLAYFNGYALWTYFTTPFLLAMPGLKVEEVEPWQEDDEPWRVLRVTFPPAIASHCPEQDFYFGPDFLLRRHDYQVDVSGGFLAAQYVYDVKDFGGFIFPTRRRAHPRLASRQPDRSRTLVSIDLSDYEVT
jgi:hypothetical protein